MIPADLFAYGEQQFCGRTFDDKLDRKRLCAQGKRVLTVMRDGNWRTLGEIEVVTHDPQASISARLRQIRAGGYTVERRRRDDPSRGLHEYRLVGV